MKPDMDAPGVQRPRLLRRSVGLNLRTRVLLGRVVANFHVVFVHFGAVAVLPQRRLFLVAGVFGKNGHSCFEGVLSERINVFRLPGFRTSLSGNRLQ